MTAPIDIFLGPLERVQKRQHGQWSARCPAHQDKGPSLSIRETNGGAVLIHCFAGCSVNSVVGALGLRMSDLFPPTEKTGHEPRRTPKLLTASHALELLKCEVSFCAVAAANLAHGVVLTEADRQRLNQAAARIAWLHEESNT